MAGERMCVSDVIDNVVLQLAFYTISCAMYRYVIILVSFKLLLILYLNYAVSSFSIFSL